MTFTLEDLPDGVLLRVMETRLDAAIAIRFKDRLREMAARHGPRLVLDLSRVDFMDSSGLGAILSIRRTLPASRVLELAALSPNVDRVFRLTRMDTIFTIHAEPPAATPRTEAPGGARNDAAVDTGPPEPPLEARP